MSFNTTHVTYYIIPNSSRSFRFDAYLITRGGQRPRTHTLQPDKTIPESEYCQGAHDRRPGNSDWGHNLIFFFS